MRKNLFLAYCVLAFSTLATFILALHFYFPSPSYIVAKGEEETRSVSPRVAMWLERKAEEKLYEEKAARLAAQPEPPVPREVQRTAGRQLEQRLRKAEREAATAASQRVQATRRAQQQAQQQQQAQAWDSYHAPRSYAPAPQDSFRSERGFWGGWR
jgi:hypothetical protein